MSLILEALRKSEAERRRGRTPDLHAELPPVHARAHRLPPPWFWIAAIAALLLAAALFWMRGREAPGAAVRTERPAADTAPGSSAQVDAREAATSPSPFPRVDRIVAPPAEPASMPAASAAPGAEEKDEDAAIATTTQAREAIVTPTTPAPAAATSDTPASPPDAPASAPMAARGPIARLSELPPAERKQLPAMKLSMHMWNERPAQRFVIIDGQRYVEGDRIGGAVIDAIDSDGVILDLNGRAVRIPIR